MIQSNLLARTTTYCKHCISTSINLQKRTITVAHNVTTTTKQKRSKLSNWLKLLNSNIAVEDANTQLLKHVKINNTTAQTQLHTEQVTIEQRYEYIQNSTTVTQLYYVLTKYTVDTVTCMNMLTALNKLAQLVQNNKHASVAQINQCINVIQPQLYSTLDTSYMQGTVAHILLPSSPLSSNSDQVITLLCNAIHSIGVLNHALLRLNQSLTNFNDTVDCLLLYIQQLLLFNKLQHKHIATLLTGLQHTGILQRHEYTYNKAVQTLLNSTITQLYNNAINATILVTYCTVFSQSNVYDQQLWQLISKHLNSAELLHSLSTTQCIQLMYTLGNKNLLSVTQRASVIVPLIQQLTKQTKLDNLTLSQLSTIVYALSQYHTRHRVIKQLLLDSTRAIISKHTQNSTQTSKHTSPLQLLHNNIHRTLMTICITSAQLAVYDTTLWSYIVQNTTINHIAHIDTYTLCNMLYSCMQLNVTVENIDTLLYNITQQLYTRIVIEQRRKGMDASTFVHILLGTIMRLHQLQQYTTNNVKLSNIQLIQHINACNLLIEAIIEYINLQLHTIEFTLEHYQQLSLVSNAITLNRKLTTQFSPAILTSIHNACKSIYQSTQQQHLQHELYKRLNRVGIELDMNVPHKQLQLYLDAVVQQPITDIHDHSKDKMEQIAMCIVPQYNYIHTIGYDKQPSPVHNNITGTTILQHKLIEQIGGYRVNVVPYYTLTNHIVTNETTQFTQPELAALMCDV